MRRILPESSGAIKAKLECGILWLRRYVALFQMPLISLFSVLSDNFVCSSTSERNRFADAQNIILKVERPAVSCIQKTATLELCASWDFPLKIHKHRMTLEAALSAQWSATLYFFFHFEEEKSWLRLIVRKIQSESGSINCLTFWKVGFLSFTRWLALFVKIVPRLRSSGIMNRRMAKESGRGRGGERWEISKKIWTADTAAAGLSQSNCKYWKIVKCWGKEKKTFFSILFPFRFRL